MFGHYDRSDAEQGGTTYLYDLAERLVGVERRDTAGTPLGGSKLIYDVFSRKVISREYS